MRYKRNTNHIWKRLFAAALISVGILAAAPVYAGGTDEANQIVEDISTLTTYITDIVQGCGSIIILYYLFDFAVNMNAAESGGMSKALRGIAAGVLFLLAPTIVDSLM